MTPSRKLFLLGAPSLQDADGNAIAGMGPGKPLAMLAYVVISGSVSRDELVALFWPETPEGRARNAFRQTLHRLRGALDVDALASDGDRIRIALADALWCDALEFRATVASDPERAIGLYRGPFLGGLDVGSSEFQHWADSHRERFEAQYRSALAIAANRALESGDTAVAAAHAATLSRAAPLDPDSALLEAKILAGAGRKPEAISVLTQHSTRLESELGEKPSAAVRAMLTRLLNEAPATAARPGETADQLVETEFVGRDKELGKLLACWRGVERRGATVLVTGPPGIGRTRLIAELARRIQAFGPALILWGQERHGNRAIPYAALADALRPAVTAPGVAGASQHLLAEAARLLPEIRDQFDLPEASAIDDEAARVRFYDGVAALLDAVAYEQPVCLILEDLHHSSRSSAELLHFLTGRLAVSPVLFVLSYRPAEAPPHVAERFSPAQARDARGPAPAPPARESVELEPLTPNAVERLLASVATGAEPDADTLAMIARMAEGNPFRGLDLLRRARRGEPLANLPTELAAALWARLQACSPPEQRLFLACALLERPAPLRLLSAATHLPEPAAFDAAVTLEQRGLVVQRRGGIAPAHDALATLALDSTGSAGRALLAGWTADAVASEPGASHAELARLYATAGQPSAAHKHARAAIHDAAASGAYDELAELLTLAAETALNTQDRSAVESLRTAFGRGRRRISGTPDVRKPKAGPAAAGPAAAGPRASARAQPTSAIVIKQAKRVLPLALGVALLAFAATVYRAQGLGAGARGTVLADTVVVTERVGTRGSRSYSVTGSMLPAASLAGAANAGADPQWVTAVSLPWVNPRVSPDGRLVAVEQITPEGTRVYVISRDQRDTVAVGDASGDNIAAGWSPDSRWLLVIHTSDGRGTYHASLHAHSLESPGRRIALDTSSAHAVTEAAWSPRGPHIAWTARTGGNRDQEVFVGLTDGTGVRNLSTSPSEDYHPTWSPDGASIAFTSERDGNAELYAAELQTGELRRLTFDASQDDRASYSPDGDFIAFESTRGGRTGVFIMPPLGGSAIRLTPADRSFALAGWRGATPAYIARLRADLPDVLEPGRVVTLSATGIDQFGAPLDVASIEWSALDRAVEIRTEPEDTTQTAGGTRGAVLLARHPGMARIIASLGAWRADTLFAVVGSAPVVLIDESFSDGLAAAAWTVLGSPPSTVVAGAGVRGSSGLVLRSGRQWESGILSTRAVPLRKGLMVTARVRAPFNSTAERSGFTLALVAAEPPAMIDPAAPQFLKVAALSWLPESGRLSYSAEREFWSEPATFARDDEWQDFRIEVEGDGRIAFYVGNRLRRRSEVVVTGREGAFPVQLWVAGRGADGDVGVDDVRLSLVGEN